MTNGRQLLVPFLIGAIAGTNQAFALGPGEAAARYHPARVDYKVLVWYRLDDPLGTFKYQVYDVRKGQYTSAVDRWVAEVRKNFAGYLVVVRDVDLARERGATEQLRVGAVIRRDLAAAAASSGIILGGTSVRVGPSPLSSPSRTTQPARLPGGINQNRDYVNPSPVPFPVPIPYPRLPF
jgi:hypothetical protein